MFKHKLLLWLACTYWFTMIPKGVKLLLFLQTEEDIMSYIIHLIVHDTM